MSGGTRQSVGNDRRYRDDVPYVLPKDLGEEERLNLQHYIFRHLLKGNYLAPLGEPVTHILDVGSGTGVWGHEMACEFPSAMVVGLDLEPPQQLRSALSVALPPNYQFVQGNVLQGLPFPDKMFDFTHQRLLSAAIPAQQWPRVVRELVRVTRPGGFVEIVESSPLPGVGPASRLLCTWLQDFLRLQGIDFSGVEEIGDMLTEAGAEQITQHPLDLPIGSWDTQIGTPMEKNMLVGVTALKPAICKHLHVAPDEFDRQLTATLHEWNQQRAHQRVYLFYGQV